VGSLQVAVRTRDLVGIVYAHRERSALHCVIFRGVAVDTDKPVGAHVDVHPGRRVGERLIQVPVLDRVPSATPEVAPTAVVSRWVGDALGRGNEVHALTDIAPGRLGVLPGSIVTDQAIHLLRVSEVEAVVDPPISHVAGGASAPV
jgi:hypothetical protein